MHPSLRQPKPLYPCTTSLPSSTHTHTHSWLCHIDDDIYVNLKPLVRILSKFDPKTEPVYVGRSGSKWVDPRLVKNGAMLGQPGQKYHFAVGGMYCLSRALLEETKSYLV